MRCTPQEYRLRLIFVHGPRLVVRLGVAAAFAVSACATEPQESSSTADFRPTAFHPRPHALGCRSRRGRHLGIGRNDRDL
jgi:hypothetical protein